ncbi:MAG: hypothetical protein WCG07_02920 [Candidatus Taylorbacteria bacterium]
MPPSPENPNNIPPVIPPEEKPKAEVPPTPPASEDQAKQDNKPENKGFFSRVSEKIESVRSSLYEGMYKIPGINKIVAKMEIAYNQVGINGNQEVAVQLKGQADSLSSRIQSLEKTKQDIITAAENLKNKGMPGSERILLKLQGLDSEKNDLLGKRDKIQSKFEAKQNRIKEYTGARDAVAGRLIESYNKKLEPINAAVETLRKDKEQLGFTGAVMEVRHQQKNEEIAGFEAHRAEIEEGLRAAGITSDSEIKFYTKELTDAITQGRAEIKKDKEAFEKEQKRIDSAIAQKTEEGNPYRDAREEFVRVTHMRPIDVRMEKRTIGEPYEQTESASSSGSEGQNNEINQESGKKPERLPVGVAIEEWNKLLKTKNEKTIPAIDSKEFFTLAKGVTKDFGVNLKEFKTLIGSYYKLKGVDSRKFETYYRSAFSKLL